MDYFDRVFPSKRYIQISISEELLSATFKTKLITEKKAECCLTSFKCLNVNDKDLYLVTIVVHNNVKY